MEQGFKLSKPDCKPLPQLLGSTHRILICLNFWTLSPAYRVKSSISGCEITPVYILKSFTPFPRNFKSCILGQLAVVFPPNRGSHPPGFSLPINLLCEVSCADFVVLLGSLLSVYLSLPLSCSVFTDHSDAFFQQACPPDSTINWRQSLWGNISYSNQSQNLLPLGLCQTQTS